MDSDEINATAEAAALIQVLLCEKKGELKKLCRSTVVTNTALADLILDSMTGVTPWTHRRHHCEFVPTHFTPGENEHLSLTKDGRATPEARKFMRKISSIFNERRLLSGHLFYNADLSNWHLIYFDQRDMAHRNNHWEAGSHIHLINYLWPHWTAQTIWDEFRTGNPMMKGALHLRYLDGRA